MLATVPEPIVSQQPRRVPRAVRERQMLDAAVAVFSRTGYHTASMDEIARRAGVSKPMVYLYLGSKQALFTACLHREGARLMEAIVTAVQTAGPPGDMPESGRRPGADERLWRGLRAFFDFVHAHRDGWNVLYRQARGEQPFAGELAAMRAGMAGVVAGLLRGVVTAQQRAVRDRDLEAAAFALVGAAESVADWFVDQPGADPEATATLMMNVVWLGARDLLGGGAWRPPAG